VAVVYLTVDLLLREEPDSRRVVVYTRGLTKMFGDILAVDHVDLKIYEGEIFGLLGPNGAGKTTIINILSALIKPTEGRAFVNGFDVTEKPDQVRKSIGVVFQDPSSDDILTGRENLYLHALMYGVPKERRSEAVRDALRLVGLEDRGGDLVKHYSGGMRRRLELARGLLHHPKILFLDEPTLGLDPQTRQHMWRYIEDLSRREGVTVILTTHYMEEADRLCDRVAIIDFGRIVALDTPKGLKRALGGGIVRLKAEGGDLDSVRRLEYVVRVEERDGYINLTVRDPGEHLQEILGLIGRVESVEMRAPTLEDVFIHYTGREMREDSAEGGFMERVVRSRVVRR